MSKLKQRCSKKSNKISRAGKNSGAEYKDDDVGMESLSKPTTSKWVSSDLSYGRSDAKGEKRRGTIGMIFSRKKKGKTYEKESGQCIGISGNYGKHVAETINEIDNMRVCDEVNGKVVDMGEGKKQKTRGIIGRIFYKKKKGKAHEEDNSHCIRISANNGEHAAEPIEYVDDVTIRDEVNGKVVDMGEGKKQKSRGIIGRIFYKKKGKAREEDSNHCIRISANNGQRVAEPIHDGDEACVRDKVGGQIVDTGGRHQKKKQKRRVTIATIFSGKKKVKAYDKNSVYEYNSDACTPDDDPSHSAPANYTDAISRYIGLSKNEDIAVTEDLDEMSVNDEAKGEGKNTSEGHQAVEGNGHDDTSEVAQPMKVTEDVNVDDYINGEEIEMEANQMGTEPKARINDTSEICERTKGVGEIGIDPEVGEFYETDGHQDIQAINQGEYGDCLKLSDEAENDDDVGEYPSEVSGVPVSGTMPGGAGIPVDDSVRGVRRHFVHWKDPMGCREDVYWMMHYFYHPTLGPVRVCVMDFGLEVHTGHWWERKEYKPWLEVRETNPEDPVPRPRSCPL